MLHLSSVLILSLILTPAPSTDGSEGQVTAGTPVAPTDVGPVAAWEALRDRALEVRTDTESTVVEPAEVQARLGGLLLEAEGFVRQYPDHREAWNLVTNLRAQLGDSTGVDAGALELQRLQPGDVQAGLSWITYYVNRGEFGEALRVNERLLEDNPRNFMFVKAWVLSMAQTDREGLERRFREDLADPGRIEDAILLTRAYQFTDPWAASAWALPLFEAAPQNPKAIEVAATALRSTNQFELTRDLLSKLPPHFLDDPKLAYLYSDCHYGSHEFERAYEIMNAIDIDGSDPAAQSLARRIEVILPLRKKAIRSWERELQKREDDEARGDNPRVELTIDGQPVLVELFQKETPVTAATFLAMVRDGHYADIPFGQVETGFRSIGGTVPEPVPYTLPSECGTPDDRHHFSGSLVTYLPHSGRPDSATSEWYILHYPAPHLNGARTVFGRVVSGLDVVRRMRPESRIEQAKILRPGSADLDPVVLNQDGTPVAYSKIMEGYGNQNASQLDHAIPPSESNQRRSLDPKSR